MREYSKEEIDKLAATENILGLSGGNGMYRLGGDKPGDIVIHTGVGGVNEFMRTLKEAGENFFDSLPDSTTTVTVMHRKQVEELYGVNLSFIDKWKA